MTDPAVPAADAAEQATPVGGSATLGERPADDVPEADAAEQATPAVAASAGGGLRDVPFEADPADAAEQATEIEDHGDDDYR